MIVLISSNSIFQQEEEADQVHEGGVGEVRGAEGEVDQEEAGVEVVVVGPDGSDDDDNFLLV